MKTEMLGIRIDHDTKVAFTQIRDEMGLGTSQAIKIFVRAVIHHGGLPFEVKPHQPNAQTVASMNELIRGEGQPVESVDALLSEVTDHQST